MSQAYILPLVSITEVTIQKSQIYTNDIATTRDRCISARSVRLTPELDPQVISW